MLHGILVASMISAVVLTHNSSRSIEATLQSLAWCGEIVVVDDDSTDTTVDIVKRYTSKIYQNTLGENFAAQRNFGLTKAKGEWVLFVDADEVVPEDLASELQKLSREKSDVVGYMISRQDVMWGKPLLHGETQTVRLLRFGKKDAGEWVRPVHEVWAMKGLIGTTVHTLAHYPHPDVTQFLASISRYSTINAKYLYSQKAPSYGWHIVAYPLAKFFVNYVLRRGFLDGTAGAIMAFMMSFHSFLVRAKLWLLVNAKK